MAGGKSSIGEVASLLIDDIWNSKTKSITKSEFLSRYIHVFDSELLDRTITTLTQAELIRLIMTNNGTTMVEGYGVTQKCIDKFELKGGQ